MALAVGVGYTWLGHGLRGGSGRLFAGRGGTASGGRAEATAARRADVEADHIRKAGDLANEFAELHGRSPRTVGELSGWACEEGKARPGDFRSTRDGRPYEFLKHGVAMAEQTGKDGRRFLYHPAMGAVELTEDVLKVLADSGAVDKRTFRRAWPDREPGAPPCCPPIVEADETAGAPH
jgi:hypothetical protein